MNDGGPRTTSIPRRLDDPTRRSARVPRPAAASASGTTGLLPRDLTTPIPVERQLARARGSKLLVGVVGTVVVSALAAALFVLPVRAWLRQRDDLAERQQQYEALDRANIQLQSEVDRLQTTEGIKEAAREEVGFTEVGEQRVSIRPMPAAPQTLPAGWPYDQVAQIVAIRTAEAATTAQDASTPTP